MQIVRSVAPSAAPTIAPTDSPSSSPTDNPTNSPIDGDIPFAEQLDQDITFWFEWVLLGVGIGVVFTTCIGTCAAKRLDFNELFRWTPLISSLFHINDFFSDIFFCLKLGVFAFATSENTHLSEYSQNIFFYLFFGCLVCIIVPVFTTLIQLHLQMSEWSEDAVLKNTDVTKWISSNITLVYLLAVLTGSSFTAIDICNCYLLKLSIFCMGLSEYHKTHFQIKRFFSVIMIENVPQLIIQIATLYLTITDDGNNDDSDDFNEDQVGGSAREDASEYYDALWITLFSMFFTLISIILGIFQFCFLQKHVKKEDCVMIVQFKLESREIEAMTPQEFSNKIIFAHMMDTQSAIAKLLIIAAPNVERLIPVQYSEGAKFTFFIQINSIQFHVLKKKLESGLKRNELSDALGNAMQLKEPAFVQAFDKILTLTDDALNTPYAGPLMKMVSKRGGMLFGNLGGKSSRGLIPGLGVGGKRGGSKSEKGKSSYVPPNVTRISESNEESKMSTDTDMDTNVQEVEVEMNGGTKPKETNSNQIGNDNNVDGDEETKPGRGNSKSSKLLE